MSSIRLDFVSQDHMVFSGDVNEIMAPGIEGQLGILPKHAPLLTILTAGEVMVKRDTGDDLFFAVSGGWMEVHPDHVTILARTAERSDEIDLKRAEAARTRAEELLAQGVERSDRAGLEMSLKRSQIRLKVAGRKSGWRPAGPSMGVDTQTPTGNHE
jgi:F-type H+-transporting ATPase subunit epsilon